MPATFFVVANENNESYLPLIRQAAQAGCEIALHSASHRYSDIYRSADAFWEDIALLRQRIAPMWTTARSAACGSPGAAPTPSAANTRGRPHGPAEGAGGGTGLALGGLERLGRGRRRQKAVGGGGLPQRHRGQRRAGAVHRPNARLATTGTTAEPCPSIIRWYKEEGYAFCTVSQLYDALE